MDTIGQVNVVVDMLVLVTKLQIQLMFMMVVVVEMSGPQVHSKVRMRMAVIFMRVIVIAFVVSMLVGSIEHDRILVLVLVTLHVLDVGKRGERLPPNSNSNPGTTMESLTYLHSHCQVWFNKIFYSCFRFITFFFAR